MGKNILFIVAFVQLLTLKAQDSKGYKISYQSNLEKFFFEEFNTSSRLNDFVLAMSVIDSSMTVKKLDDIKTRIAETINGLPFTKESKATKEKKRIKKIYDKIHKAFFSKYIADANFSDIFSSGNYNCLGATAMYAYVFDRLEVPFKIKEEPGHVFVIVYPESHNIYLETTVPGEYGYYTLDDKSVKEVVNELVSVKLISKQELEEKGYKQCYKDYFFTKNYLSTNSLVGVQYYNQAFKFIAKENYRKAFNSVKKAEVFYKTELVTYLKKNLLKLILYSDSLSKDDLSIVIEAFGSLELEEDFTKADLDLIVYKLITKNIQEADFLDLLQDSFNKVPNDLVKNIVISKATTYAAQLKAKDGNYEEAFNLARKAYKFNIENREAKEVLTWTLRKKIALLSFSKTSLDKINAFIQEFPFVKEDNIIKEARSRIVSKLAYDSFSTKKISEGEKYIDIMESLLESSDNLLINPELYCQVYLKAGQHYYGKMQLSKAEEKLRKGLKFNPEHVDLNRVLKYVLEEK